MPRCKDCKHWKPDIFFSYMGNCSERKVAIGDGEGPCKEFKLKENTEEFLWCRDCRMIIYRAEKGRHRGHELFSSFHIDYDAHELTRTGD